MMLQPRPLVTPATCSRGMRPLAAAALCVLAGALAACTDPAAAEENRPQTSLPRGEIQLAGRSFSVQIAHTEASRRKGLMFTNALAENDGMVFCFPQPIMLNFYMRNVPIALDIAYIRSDGSGGWIVDSIHTMAARDERLYPSANACLFALEVRAGTFAALGVRPGTPVQIGQPILDAQRKAE